jgi:hypothetical protein
MTAASATDQHWPWWPLLPLYPYGRRPTLVRELIPRRIWSFEQLHGVWYVAVPIRMTVVRVEEGLLLYSPIPPTGASARSCWPPPRVLSTSFRFRRWPGRFQRPRCG